MHVVCQRQVAKHDCATPQGAARANHGAAGHADTASHGGVVAHLHVMANLHQVVELDAVAQYRVVQRTPIDTGIGAKLNIVANTHRPHLRNLDPVRTVCGKAKSVRTQHHTRMQHSTRTHLATRPNRDVRRQVRPLTQQGMRAKHAMGPNYTVRSHLGPRLNHCKWPHMDRSRQHHPGRHVSAGMHTRLDRRLGSRKPPLTQARVVHIGVIGHDGTGIGCRQRRQQRRRQHRRRGAGAGHIRR